MAIRGRRFRPGRAAPRLLALLAGLALLYAAWHGAYALYPFPYRAAVQGAAAAGGIDPRLVLALMRVESKFGAQAVSRDGAIGLMQVTPPTGAWIAAQRGGAFSPGALRDPAYNIAAGTWYLAYLRGTFDGRITPAIAAYNAGARPVQAWIASGAWDATLSGASSIPYPETRLFVQRVLGTYAVYRLLYPGRG